MAHSDSSVPGPREPRDDGQTHEASENLGRSCFYCLEGWVFLGSIGPEGGRCTRPSAAGGVAVRASSRLAEVTDRAGVLA